MESHSVKLSGVVYKEKQGYEITFIRLKGRNEKKNKIVTIFVDHPKNPKAPDLTQYITTTLSN